MTCRGMFTGWLLVASLVGCGGGGEGDPRANDAGAPTCGSDGIRFALNGAFHASSKDAVLYENSKGGIVGLAGTVGASQFLFRRDGDLGDGDFESVTTYDVSQYPYNVVYVESPMLAGCENSGGASCSGFYALAGAFTVTQVSPTYKATFSLRMLRDGAAIEGTPGSPMDGEVTGCIQMPNP